MLLFGQGKGDALRFLVTNDSDGYRRSSLRPMRLQRVVEIAAVMHRILTDTDNDVTRAESGFFRPAASLHRPDQHTVSVLGSKVVAQLRSEIFNHQATAHRGVHHDHGYRHVKIG